MRQLSKTLAPGEQTLDATILAVLGRPYVARAGSWLIAYFAVMALFFGVVFVEQLATSRLLPVLALLILLHLALYPRLFMVREIWLYGAFVAYMGIALLWTADIQTALNTMFPAVDFLLSQILIAALLRFHDRRAVLRGMIAGFMSASIIHTMATGFPFAIAVSFSYNAVALVYIFGLFLVILYGCVFHARTFATPLALVMLLHVVATTSIKANLGVVAGALIAAIVYVSVAMQLVRRNIGLIVLALVAIGYVIATNEAILDRMQYALHRLEVGIQVLEAREDVQGYSGFNERNEWMQLAIEGMKDNPLFGNGVEAFRAKYGVTSHSTAGDLLYNVGLIGCTLFYLTFISLGLRLLTPSASDSQAIRATILATLVCFLSMTFSGTIFYHPLLGAFLTVSACVLHGTAIDRRSEQS
ncbi:MAG: hypothetical protein ABI769_17740 [Pseudomonadota bacterium]